jgi:hypothetical protein
MTNWICGITGCNKYPLSLVVVPDYNLDVYISILGGDPKEDLVLIQEAMDDPFKNPKFYMTLDCDQEYKVFYLGPDSHHDCFIEKKNGRRLYCVKADNATFDQVKEWIEETIV